MDLYVTVCFLLFGTFLFPLPLLHECKKPKDCTFQVNNVTSCPSNQTEWNKRSDDMNCNGTNGYVCVPNERFTELLEFCYNVKQILILEGHCLYFNRKWSEVGIYNCRNFEYGCPYKHYLSSKIYEYPSCIHVEKGCFVAELSCKSHPPQEENQINNTTLLISLGVSIPAFFLLVLLFIKTTCRKRKKETEFEEKYGKESHIRRRGRDIPMDMDKIERSRLLENFEVPESFMDKDIFYQWEQDDYYFISTRACKEVEKIIKSRNLVIVAGHSGSGKSAIIQHIALKYRKQGWTVRRVTEVKDIVDEYNSSRFKKDKTICVFYDPLGKESFDEILNNSWQTYEEELHLYLKTSKIVMSCRNRIISDARMAHNLVNKSHNIININDNKYELSVEEKREILTKYTSDMNLSDKDRHKIVEVERYFPLLCKLYSSKEGYKNKGIKFFTEPVTVLKEEILRFRITDKGKYCALALLVLFNGDLCVSDLLKNEDTEYKFKHTLKLCGLPENIPPSAIADYLYSLKDSFVKKVGDTYYFYHDFLMEVTTYVFGTDYPTETIKYADIGFLRRRVKLENFHKDHDLFPIYLSDRHIEKLADRLYTELFRERLVDVVLNPCLSNEKVIEVMKKKMAEYPEKLLMLLETRKLTTDKHDFDRTSKNILMSKLKFLELDSKVSPLFALIAFCHTKLSQYCVNILQIDLTKFSLISAICCNGSIELFNNATKDREEELFNKTCGCLYPIHIVSVFHNYKQLHKLIKLGADVNQKTLDNNGWTPLTLATGNDTQENGEYNNRKSIQERRDKTVQLLLSSKANINLCTKNGASPLYVACENGHDSTVQLLLENGADLREKDGASPLYVACQNGHDSTVNLLLSSGADINLCTKNGASPLYVACQNGHDSTVQLLLNKEANIHSYKKNGASPLHVACQNKYDRIVEMLLRSGANIHICEKNEANPLHVACFFGHDSTALLLLNKGADINFCNANGTSPLNVACQNGHDSTVQLLLSNGADINVCTKDGASPLYEACHNGHDSTALLLLNEGADINCCNENGTSPLNVACQNGHDSTVQLLLSKGADINVCTKDGASPLYEACQNGHDSTVQLLLNYGADINICNKNGASPLNVACQNGHESTVQLLLSNGAVINFCNKNVASPLFVACRNGHDSTVQLLLSKGADINFCNENGTSPLNVALQNGHDSTVQLLLSYGEDIILY